MNISLPVASIVDSVDFCFLSPAEIRSISVKRIENDSTFDNLLNPVPGGLYDPALGSWGDSPCSTCNLVQSSCPGHAGHIDLPVPVYHPIFMDQTFRLLRSQCVYCKGFRLAPRVLNRFTCKLRLLRYGLVREAHLIDAIGQKMHGLGPEDLPSEGDMEAEEADSTSVDTVIRARDSYVGESIRKHLRARQVGAKSLKHEGAGDMRLQIIRDLLSELPKSRTCHNCGGVSPSYRKDRFVKIFEKALNAKEKVKMAQKKLRITDAMAGVRKSGKPTPAEVDDGVSDITDSAASKGEELDDGTAIEPEVASQNGPSTTSSDQRYLSAMEVRARLAELFEREREILSLVYSARPISRKSNRISVDMFFITTLLIPPNRYRPEARTGDSQIAEAQQNSLYKIILRHCERIAHIHRLLTRGESAGQVDGEESGPETNMVQLHLTWTGLQDAVNSLIDKSKNPVQGAASKRNEDGIKQKLEKKEGLFRMNMMGKRVNYAARSVISPDPNLETNEIGVPPVFAKKLTYPEPVTSHNFRDLQQAVINGSEKWPGASAIENENGQIVNLRGKSVDDRISLANQLLTPSNVSASGAKNKKVYRHITNGDVVLMNRQPSLHRPSIMGHRVRVLPGEKTLRMHYANCNTYNADFDGDEMNMHFPQNEVARVEALQIADTDHQYISTTQGQPLRGLIQDHISVAVGLCSRDTLFDRAKYHQLVYNALRPENGHILGDRIELIPPAIMKPAKRWTGKQVITTLLKNLTPGNCGGLWMNAPTKISSSEWGQNSEEGMVVIQDGYLVTGILDKSHIGPSSGGLVHAVHEVYGPTIAGKFLSSLGRLLTKYLNMRAFSCGMDDLRLTPAGELARKNFLTAADDIGLETAANYVSLPSQKRNPELAVRLEEVMRDDSKLAGLDLLMSGACNKIKNELVKGLMPAALSKKFPSNRMQTMTVSGAKGSIVNATLISCSLGQQVLEGRRVPLMISGKSLPCFDPFETHARAGGFVVGRFLTGIRPQEYYFHHMTGREGLIDTAVKTSRSGYLQRCVVKGMEGLTVTYDSTVRDSDGSMIQFLYGEDGLDVTKQKYLKDFGFLLRNIKSEMSQLRFSSEIFSALSERRDDIMRHMKSAIKRAKSGDSRAKDPANSLVNPARFAFATSESFYDSMSAYINSNPDKLIRSKSKDESKMSLSQPTQPTVPRTMAETLFSMKYVRSMVEPGEAVGIVAGQSVGEPSTQMTLNTFHLAGHSGSNVTLGIPRLREILMTARKTISTPTMTLYLDKSMTPEASDKLAKSMSILPMGHIIDQATVKERIGRGTDASLVKAYDIQLQFFPGVEYTSMYGITVGDVMTTVERRFLKRLLILIRKEIKKSHLSTSAATPDVGVKAGVVEMASANAEGDGPTTAADNDDGNEDDDDDDDDDDGDGDDDATKAKQRANRVEAVSYGANDDDDDAIRREQEAQAESEDDEDAFEDEGLGGSPSPPPPPLSNDDGMAGDESDEAADDETKKKKKGRREGSGGGGGGGVGSGERAERIIDTYREVTRFSCDEYGGDWCRITLEFDIETPKILVLNKVQDALRHSVVQQIAGVRTCTYVADKAAGGTADEAHIQVDGINLRAMRGFGKLVDCDRIRTNDISAILETYGVEACRGAIISELAHVFRSHAITVDTRHLNLIADYMTRNGRFTAFNRTGLKGNASPFTKMSFETTLAFLKDAVLDGDWDELATPSSRLVVGNLGKLGTGSFDVLTRVPT